MDPPWKKICDAITMQSPARTKHSMQVDESVKEVASVVRENIVLRAAQAFASQGHIATYIHNSMGPSCGAMCSAVALENDALDLSHNPPARVVEFGKQLAMQVSQTSLATFSRFLCMPETEKA